MDSRLIFRPHLIALDGVTKEIKRRGVVVTLSPFTRGDREANPPIRVKNPILEKGEKFPFRNNSFKEPSKKSL